MTPLPQGVPALKTRRFARISRMSCVDNGAGVVEYDLKEMLRAYVAFTIECGY